VALVRLDVPWDSQPQEVVGPNPSAPAGLVSLWLPQPGRGRDLVRGIENPAAAPASSFVLEPTNLGIGFRFDDKTQDGTGFRTNNFASAGSKRLTVVAMGRQTVGVFADYRFLQTTDYEAIPDSATSFQIYVSGSHRFTASWTGLAQQRSIILSHDLSSSANDPVVLVDGVLATITRHSTPATPDITGTVHIGGHIGAPRPFPGFMVGAALFDTTPPLGLLQEIGANPWQLFVPRQIWIPASAASALPTLSNPTAINITASSFQPRVSYAF
jgi:hypothetical protein